MPSIGDTSAGVPHPLPVDRRRGPVYETPQSLAGTGALPPDGDAAGAIAGGGWMPIFRCRDKLVFYAHVPKCAGSAVNRYLAERFGALAFQDERFLLHPQDQRWSRTSPQHIDREARARLFPEGFFDASFTIVRHPVARAVSIYNFQREVEHTIPEETGFSAWLEGLPGALARDPRAFDNHARPMDDIVPEDATVFRLEDGTEDLIAWLDALQGEAAGPRAITPANRRSDRRGGVVWMGTRNGARAGAPPVRPSAEDLEVIAAIYERDFSRFGYPIEASGARPARAPHPVGTAPAGGRRPRWLASLLGRG